MKVPCSECDLVCTFCRCKNITDYYFEGAVVNDPPLQQAKKGNKNPVYTYFLPPLSFPLTRTPSLFSPSLPLSHSRTLSIINTPLSRSHQKKNTPLSRSHKKNFQVCYSPALAHKKQVGIKIRMCLSRLIVWFTKTMDITIRAAELVPRSTCLPKTLPMKL